MKFFDLFFQSDYPQGFLLLLLLFFTISLHFSCTFLLDLFYFKVLDICAEFTDDRLRFPQGIFLCRFSIKKFSGVDIDLLIIISFHLQTFGFAVSTSNNKNINLFLQTVDNPNFLFSWRFLPLELSVHFLDIIAQNLIGSLWLFKGNSQPSLFLVVLNSCLCHMFFLDLYLFVKGFDILYFIFDEDIFLGVLLFEGGQLEFSLGWFYLDLLALWF